MPEQKISRFGNRWWKKKSKLHHESEFTSSRENKMEAQTIEASRKMEILDDTYVENLK